MKIFFNLKPWVQAIISGFVIGIAYHPFNLGFLAWVGFIPLFNVFINGDLKKNIINGYIFGLIYNLTAFYWIGSNSGADFITVFVSLIAAVLYLSIYWSIVGIIVSIIPSQQKQILSNILFPFLIVTVEWIRSFGALGFPWANIALTQSKYIYLLQMLEITGTYGISFIVISINVIIYNSLKNDAFIKDGLLKVMIL